MVVPSEIQILEAVKSHLNGNTSSLSDADLTRLLTTLELENDWSDVSPKKFHSVLCKHDLVSSTNNNATPSSSTSASKKKKKSKTDTSIPKSFIDPSIPMPSGIRGEYFDAVKGKGLVAERSFAEGELLFTEEAYIPTPPPEAFDQVVRGELCGQCFLPVSSAPVQLAIKNCSKCKNRFCTSACYKTAMATHHNLLCTGLNPAAKDLMELVQKQKWQSLHSAARSISRLMSTVTSYNTTPGGRTKEDEGDLLEKYGDFEEVFSRLSSFATVSELERRSRNPGWTTEKASFESILDQAHQAIRLALDPYHPSRSSKPDPNTNHVLLDLIESSPTRKSAVKDLFTLPFFLKLLGRANINMEKFGGLYSLHSFLNHSCSPNVQIRHPPERGILTSMKVAALALRPIAKGEELVISYIDPNTRLGRRQLLLYRDYCFGPCVCDKCQTELEAMGLKYDPTKHGVKGFLDSVAKKTGDAEESKQEQQSGAAAGDASLEEELRASLGF